MPGKTVGYEEVKKLWYKNKFITRKVKTFLLNSSLIKKVNHQFSIYMFTILQTF